MRKQLLNLVLLMNVLVAVPAQGLIAVGEVATPGVGNDVVFDGVMGYVADGFGGLRVIDFSDPERPLEIGSVPTLDDTRAVAIGEGTAYVADARGGLRVVDISDPTDPVEVSHIDLFAFDVELSADRLYVRTDLRLEIFDVSAPHQPLALGSWFHARRLMAFTVENGLAYSGFRVSSREHRLIIMDLSSPTNPVELGSAPILDAGSFINDVELRNGLAHVAVRGIFQDHPTVRTFDVSSPDSVKHLSTFTTRLDPADIELAGNLLFYVDGLGFHVVDMSNPSAPAKIGELDTAPLAKGLAISTDFAFVSQERRGVVTIDLSELVFPAVIAALDKFEDSKDVDVVDGLAFAASPDDGLVVVDVSGDLPVVIGESDAPVNAESVHVSGDLAYVADRAAGLRVFDVSKPTAPEELAVAPEAGVARGVVVEGTLAFVGSHDGLLIFDGADPSAPGLLSSTGPLPLGPSLTVVGDRVYAVRADSVRWVSIFDVSDPVSPVQLGTVRQFASSVAARGDVLFIATGASGLRAFDVSDAASPVQIGELLVQTRLGVAFLDLKLVGSIAFAAGGSSGVRAVDISDPTHLRELGAVRSDAPPVAGRRLFHLSRAIDVENDLVYSVGDPGGFRVFDFGPEYRFQRVEIDIRPHAPNLVNLQSKGWLRVVVLGSEDFDAEAVDPSSLRFGPGEAGSSRRPLFTDSNRDGFIDLIASFRLGEVGLSVHDDELCVIGNLTDGSRFEGCDEVVLVGR